MLSGGKVAVAFDAKGMVRGVQKGVQRKRFPKFPQDDRGVREKRVFQMGAPVMCARSGYLGHNDGACLPSQAYVRSVISRHLHISDHATRKNRTDNFKTLVKLGIRTESRKP